MKRFYILFLILLFSCSSIDNDIPFSYSVDTLNVEIGYPVSFDISVNKLLVGTFGCNRWQNLTIKL